MSKGMCIPISIDLAQIEMEKNPIVCGNSNACFAKVV